MNIRYNIRKYLCMLGAYTDQVTKVVYYFVFRPEFDWALLIVRSLWNGSVPRAWGKDKVEERKSPWPHFKNACAWHLKLFLPPPPPSLCALLFVGNKVLLYLIYKRCTRCRKINVEYILYYPITIFFFFCLLRKWKK